MKLVGQTYLYRTELAYSKEHNGKEVTIKDTNGFVSICETDEGERFAAFNTDLRYSMRDALEKYEPRVTNDFQDGRNKYGNTSTTGRMSSKTPNFKEVPRKKW